MNVGISGTKLAVLSIEVSLLWRCLLGEVRLFLGKKIKMLHLRLD